MDGFDYLTNIVPSRVDPRFGRLESLTNIRNSGLLHGVVYTAPEGLATLGPQGSYFSDFVLAENSFLYAFCAIEDGEVTATPTINRFSFKIFEKPGQSIIEQYVRSSFGQDYTMRGKVSGVPAVERQGLPFQILDKPVQIFSNRLTVEISNPSTSETIRPCVLLICASPAAAAHDRGGRLCA